jgi:hypothetical protein
MRTGTIAFSSQAQTNQNSEVAERIGRNDPTDASQETTMSIIRMATLPGKIYPAQRTRPSVRMPGEAMRVRKPRARGRIDAFGWRTWLTEAYPAIGLALIVGYLVWVLVLGESALPWAGDLSSAE